MYFFVGDGKAVTLKTTRSLISSQGGRGSNERISEVKLRKRSGHVLRYEPIGVRSLTAPRP